MLDIGWQELFVVAVIVLVVVGPKDLPRVMRSLARVVRKVQAMSREFQGGVAQMMRESELDDLRRKMEEAGQMDMGRTFDERVDPTGFPRTGSDQADRRPAPVAEADRNADDGAADKPTSPG